MNRILLAAAAALTLGGCATAPREEAALGCQPDGAEAPTASAGADGLSHRQIDVLTYNIEGLGPPARWNRDGQLAEIGRRLAGLREAGEAPDVVVFQEVFSESAKAAVRAAGYPYRVSGPGPLRTRQSPALGRVPGHRRWTRGEIGVRFAGSGLVIASRWPILLHRGEPFGHHACAGLDCLSNKGALVAEVLAPGLPEPLQVFDSHLNSGRHARVGRERAHEAHALEARELAGFVGAAPDPVAPAVLAGDFNVRHSAPRFADLNVLSPMTLVHRFCLDPANGCDVRAHWSAQTPWLDTEDLQFFRSGGAVTVRPVRVQTMFDGASGPVLSDHVGFRVTYDLSWRPSATPASAPQTCRAMPAQRRS